MLGRGGTCQSRRTERELKPEEFGERMRTVEWKGFKEAEDQRGRWMKKILHGKSKTAYGRTPYTLPYYKIAPIL